MIPYHALARFLAEVITGLLAYIITIAPIGYFRAWVAKKMGDPSAEEQGFLTLNPFAHISIIGILLIFSLSNSLRALNIVTGPFSEFIFFGFVVFLCVAAGLHTIRIPIFDLANYHHPYRTLKIAVSSFSGFFAYLYLGIIALITLALLGGKVSLTDATQFSLVMVAITCIRMCAIFAMFDLFIYSTFLIMNRSDDDQIGDLQSRYFFISLIALLLIMFFGDDISNLLLYGISITAQSILALMHYFSIG